MKLEIIKTVDFSELKNNFENIIIYDTEDLEDESINNYTDDKISKNLCVKSIIEKQEDCTINLNNIAVYNKKTNKEKIKHKDLDKEIKFDVNRNGNAIKMNLFDNYKNYIDLDNNDEVICKEKEIRKIKPILNKSDNYQEVIDFDESEDFFDINDSINDYIIDDEDIEK